MKKELENTLKDLKKGKIHTVSIGSPKKDFDNIKGGLGLNPYYEIIYKNNFILCPLGKSISKEEIITIFNEYNMEVL